MAFSEFLNSRRERIHALVDALHKEFSYVSVLGVDNRSRVIRADSRTTLIGNGPDMQCGFVVKLNRGGAVFEHSMDDIDENIGAIAAEILTKAHISPLLTQPVISGITLGDPPLTASYCRPSDLEQYTDKELLDFCKSTQRSIQEQSSFVMNAGAVLITNEVSKLFISTNRELDQNYTWINGILFAVYRENERIVQVREGEHSCLMADVLAGLPGKIRKLLHTAHCLTLAGPVDPGVYDVITDPSISGLIAHEAFGHGVEMDQFVKDRALARQYVGKYVASPICNMRDGAASAVSAASYFFDDDGVLAGDTQIIKNGILVAGLSDQTAAAELGTIPTGNGRRESARRKSYSRMTNTFFEAGTDKLEDMIASVSHGYMLFETDNGMEDPKNWAIQCVAQYGIEIMDGKLTDNYVSPVVMSGYVPDLLSSISMVSDHVVITGAGACGKGYKEWVRVSDGGPALKVRVKLG